MSERNFFSELKRRHVDKVALVYAVVAWLLIEIAWILLPTLDAPAWMMEALVVLLALGFIVALIISWSFEMTPEGMKRTADVTPSEVLPYWSKRKFATFVIGAAVIAFGLLAYQLLRSKGPGSYRRDIAPTKSLFRVTRLARRPSRLSLTEQCALNTPTMIAAAAITSLRVGNWIAPVSRLNTTVTAMIT
jgi:hypothetical protein